MFDSWRIEDRLGISLLSPRWIVLFELGTILEQLVLSAKRAIEALKFELEGRSSLVEVISWMGRLG